ncbi:MAG: hypothetical protein JNM40_07715 [Myxococcales bacterium]|nr:hypothetical protein [Myxococcales bacterium]
MRSERALGTLNRVLRRLSFVGIAAGIAVSTMWNGCAGTNPDAVGNIVDGGTDDGPPPGSDLTCQKTPDPDVPDSLFIDNNCDGIDGDIANAIFVSPSGDDTFAGTRENPVKTVTQGIKLAQQQGKTGVYLDKGIYTGSVAMVAGIGVYGGYDSGNLWARSAANESLIQGGTTAITLSNIAKETHLELVSVKSADGTSAGQSSYGVFVVNSSGPVIIGQAKINSGNGANGTSPTAPTDVITPVAANGATGGNGCTGGGCNPAGPGGKGGQNTCSAVAGNVSGGNGGNGSVGNSGGGGAAGLGGAPGTGGGGGSSGDCFPGFYKGNSGSGGTDGGAGADGTLGTQPVAVSASNFTAAGYTPASGGDGKPGTNGSGAGGGGAGGGGAGGACKPDAGGGGGGGGAGGCAAAPGLGGGGGGGSFGVYIFKSTVTLNSVSLASGQAGNGGTGANGAIGGSAGTGSGGGAGSEDSAGGGRGANGGKGGNSGAGSGGSGGPSYGLYSQMSQVVTNSVQASGGAFGSAGNGGKATLKGVLSQAPAGFVGQAAPLKFE